MIKINEKIPNIPLYIVKDEQSTPIGSHDVLKGKCVLFGIPGAFTKTCSNVQVPSYVNNRKVFDSLGIDSVVCLAVNDPYVLEVWSQTLDPAHTINFVSDGNYDFSQSLDLLNDLRKFGMGIRSRRYAMLLEDYTLKLFQLDEIGVGCILSKADSFIEEVKKYYRT